MVVPGTFTCLKWSLVLIVVVQDIHENCANFYTVPPVNSKVLIDLKNIESHVHKNNI